MFQKHMNKLKDFAMYSAALFSAASQDNSIFDLGSRHHYQPSLDNPQVQRMADFNAHRITLREFSIHGIKIQAKSKKDAIKIYNQRNRKS